MISVLRKLAQVNIKYRKKWAPHNKCLHWDPPDEVTARPCAYPAEASAVCKSGHCARQCQKPLSHRQNTTPAFFLATRESLMF